MRKKIILIFVSIILPISFSCEDLRLFVDCTKCYSTLSDVYNLEYKITLDKENPYVPITLYQGKIDDGVIIDVDTIFYLPHYSKPVSFGNYYSAVARYRRNGRVIFAVDGRQLEKKLDNSSCQEACYTIHGDMLDLRLK